MISYDDEQAFAEAMRDVTPLRREERAPRTSRPSATARQRRAADCATLEESLARPNGEHTGEDMEFRRPGLADRAFRDLRRGRLRIEDEIDLHGFTRSEARAVLREFLASASERGVGCVRVVHGKGRRSGPDGPVLKDSVHLWLSQWDEVLAFVSARQKHGGGGAVCVLLRSR